MGCPLYHHNIGQVFWVSVCPPSHRLPEAAQHRRQCDLVRWGSESPFSSDPCHPAGGSDPMQRLRLFHGIFDRYSASVWGTSQIKLASCGDLAGSSSAVSKASSNRGNLALGCASTAVHHRGRNVSTGKRMCGGQSAPPCPVAVRIVETAVWRKFCVLFDHRSLPSPPHQNH